MKPKKKLLNWPVIYEAPKVFNIDTAYQQALGITVCAAGFGAEGQNSCVTGTVAVGGESCATGIQANPHHEGHACTKGFVPAD